MRSALERGSPGKGRKLKSPPAPRDKVHPTRGPLGAISSRFVGSAPPAEAMTTASAWRAQFLHWCGLSPAHSSAKALAGKHRGPRHNAGGLWRPTGCRPRCPRHECTTEQTRSHTKVTLPRVRPRSALARRRRWYGTRPFSSALASHTIHRSQRTSVGGSTKTRHHRIVKMRRPVLERCVARGQSPPPFATSVRRWVIMVVVKPAAPRASQRQMKSSRSC